MKKRLFIIPTLLILLLVVMSTFASKKDVYIKNITHDILRTGNFIVDKDDITDEILDKSIIGYQKVNMYIDNNTITFNKTNVYSDLDNTIINKVLSSDKSKWYIITNNLVEEYTYNDNTITINDDNITSVSISVMDDDEEYNVAIIKEDDVYYLRKSNIKLLHGGLNSLWYQYFYDLDTAIKAAKNNDYIILYDDITVNNTINIDKTINILSEDNNNYIITNDNGYLFNITNKITINLNNIIINTDSFVKGKDNAKIVLGNTVVKYKDSIFPKKSKIKKNIYSDNNQSFIKEAI